MQAVQAFWSAHSSVILGSLFFLSEALAQIPAVKANSIFQLVFGWLQKKQSPSS